MNEILPEVISRPYNGADFQFTVEGYVNISPVSKVFGKRPGDYLRLQRTQEYIQALVQKYTATGNPATEETFVYSVVGGDPQKQGTWLHPKLLIDFARWVNPEFALWCDEQVESILKANSKPFIMPTTLLEAGKLWVAELEAHEETKALLADAKQIIEANKPKVTYHDVVLKCPNLVSVSEIAKDFGISAVKLNKILARNKVQYKDRYGRWAVCQEYKEEGLAATSTRVISEGGISFAKQHLKWTQKGRMFIYEVLKAEGVLPICEQSD